MPNKLKNVKVHEGSLVDLPANPRARVVLFKRKGGDEEVTLRERLTALFKSDNPVTFSLAYQESEMEEDWWQIQDALRKSIRSILESNVENKKQLIQQTLNEYMDKLAEIIPIMESKTNQVVMLKFHDVGCQLAEIGDGISMSDKEIDVEQLNKSLSEIDEMIKSQSKIKEGDGGGMSTLEEFLKGLSEDQRSLVQDQLKKKEQEIEEARKRAEEAEQKLSKFNPNQNPEPEDVWKGVSPAIRQRFEEMEKRAKEAEDIAKREQEERAKREFIAKAQNFKSLAVNPEEFGPVLKSLNDLDPDAFGKIESVLKAADEAISKGELFEEFGKNGTGTVGTDSWSKLQKAAEDLRKSDPNMTQEQAITKAAEVNPELVAAYRKGV